MSIENNGFSVLISKKRQRYRSSIWKNQPNKLLPPVECCILIWNSSWDPDVVFAYIKKRKTTWQLLLGWNRVETASWSVFGKYHRWKSSTWGYSSIRKNTGVETMVLRLPRLRKWRQKGGNQGKYLLSTYAVSAASRGSCYLHFTDEKPKAQRCGRSCPGSQSLQWSGLEFTLRFARLLVPGSFCYAISLY